MGWSLMTQENYFPAAKGNNLCTLGKNKYINLFILFNICSALFILHAESLK